MSARLFVQDLAFRYLGGFAVGPVDISLGPGVHWLRGPNGGGKTTLLGCLCGSLRPDRGRVSVDGRDLLREHAARGLVSLLAAEPDLPPGPGRGGHGDAISGSTRQGPGRGPAWSAT